MQEKKTLKKNYPQLVFSYTFYDSRRKNAKKSCQQLAACKRDNTLSINFFENDCFPENSKIMLSCGHYFHVLHMFNVDIQKF